MGYYLPLRENPKMKAIRSNVLLKRFKFEGDRERQRALEPGLARRAILSTGHDTPSTLNPEPNLSLRVEPHTAEPSCP